MFSDVVSVFCDRGRRYFADGKYTYFSIVKAYYGHVIYLSFDSLSSFLGKAWGGIGRLGGNGMVILMMFMGGVGNKGRGYDNGNWEDREVMEGMEEWEMRLLKIARRKGVEPFSAPCTLAPRRFVGSLIKTLRYLFSYYTLSGCGFTMVFRVLISPLPCVSRHCSA